MRRKKIPEYTDNQPKIKGQFAFTEYPRFIRRLADDSGLGSLWTEVRQASRAYSEKIWELAQAANGAEVEPDQKAKVVLQDAESKTGHRAEGR